MLIMLMLSEVSEGVLLFFNMQMPCRSGYRCFVHCFPTSPHLSSKKSLGQQ